jgi:hypothetical protein
MQTKLQSLLESAANILIGYTVAVVSQLVLFPWFGIHIPLSDNLIIGLWFTVISLARSYGLRRFFNWFHSAQMATRLEKIKEGGVGDGGFQNKGNA